MDDLTATRAAFTRAIGDVTQAMERVRAARDVHWVSVLAATYRTHLHQVLYDLARCRDRLEDARQGLS